MNIPALETELLAVLTSTSNLTATEKTKLRNRFVAAFPTEFARFLTANSLTDTAANRGAFVVNQTVRKYWGEIYISGSSRENQAALPAPDSFE